ncbi:MAG: GGDEF domain-containing protein [Clostridiales bacterium]|nr:GGDEF domain-containing protein [Clostridiales bacterium]HOA84655.1 GGDEF domain-containing protein [Bacillota bacterium]
MDFEKAAIDGPALIEKLDDAVDHVFVPDSSGDCNRCALLYVRSLPGGAPAEDSISAFLSKLAGRNREAECEIRFRICDSEGEHVWFRARMKLLGYTDKSHSFAVEFENITTKKALETLRRNQALQAALEAAHKDSSTGVYNKYFTEDIIRDKLSEGDGKLCLLLILDVDLLKNINDTYGHPIGDLALKKIACAMSSCLGRGDIIGRIGGDEFMALICGLRDEQAARELVEQLFCRISEIKICGFNLSVSIGCVMTRSGTEDFDTLYRRADTALYHVKRNKKNDYKFYTPDMDT